MDLIKGAFVACPFASFAFWLGLLTGVGHAVWTLVSIPLASPSEIIGVGTVWFGPWLVMGFSFIWIWANGIKVLRSTRRSGIRN